MGLAGEAARVADVMGRAAARLGEGPAEAEEPDETAFEAVRRKVLGIGAVPLPSGVGGTRAGGVGG
jgi:hypothetical protein